MAKTVSEVFVETLIEAGVRRVYGVVGDSLNGLTDAIRKSKQIDWLHMRHEETAAFAAGADARAVKRGGIGAAMAAEMKGFPKLARLIREYAAPAK